MTRRATSARRRAADLVLVLNAGSSTLKGSLLALDGPEPIAAVTTTWGGDPVERAPGTIAAVLERLGVDPARLVGIGHRVVHGGPDLVRPVVIDDRTLAMMRSVVSLAPLHVPPSLAVIEAVSVALPGVAQVACFDTAFHASLPEISRRYPVPDDWTERLGIRRYGFHGLSVAWATGAAAGLLGMPPSRARLVVAHLGAGSSVTAVDGGRSVDTSMGFTPLEGLMMATRSGSIDPGILITLARDHGLALDALDDALHHRSGLLGVGGSGDMVVLQARARAGDARARTAIAMYVDRAAAAIAGAATRLPALDAVVFTGGIGEHAVAVRGAIVRRLGVVGIPRARDLAGPDDRVLSARGAHPAVIRVTAREDLEIRGAVLALIGG
ncbi:MAG: acetate/propionate family kinase [Chloroflexota bacterium]